MPQSLYSQGKSLLYPLDGRLLLLVGNRKKSKDNIKMDLGNIGCEDGK
jgi:hypothetical protein